MPVLKAIRALLMLVALAAIAPAQAGGALAVADAGLGFREASVLASPDGPTRDKGAMPVPAAAFSAPDDGAPAQPPLPDRPLSISASPRATMAAAIESAAGLRLDRPPKSD